MLMPKRTKFRRPHRVSYEGKAKGAKKVDFGEYGLQALEGSWITAAQIEAARIAMTRYMKREGSVWIRIFPHIARTKKPLAVRMGGGKGSPEGYVAVYSYDVWQDFTFKWNKRGWWNVAEIELPQYEFIEMELVGTYEKPSLVF